jgi:hypothetical protein
VPVALRVGGAVLAVEGLVAVVLGLLEAFAVTGSRLTMGVTTAIFLIVYGAALGLVGYGLSRAAGWSRAPAVLTQLLQLGVAWSFRGGSTTWVAVILGLAALYVLVSVFLRSSLAALTAGR